MGGKKKKRKEEGKKIVGGFPQIFGNQTSLSFNPVFLSSLGSALGYLRTYFPKECSKSECGECKARLCSWSSPSRGGAAYIHGEQKEGLAVLPSRSPWLKVEGLVGTSL